MIPRKTLNLGYLGDESYVLSNGHETCQNDYDQIIMKHISWLSDFAVKMTPTLFNVYPLFFG